MARTKEQPAFGTITNGAEVIAPNFVRGFHSALSDRYWLHWTAGSHGKPGLAALLTNSVANYAITDRDFEVVAGTNSTSALATYNAEGGITLTTAGAAADQEIIGPTTTTNTSPWRMVTWGSDQQTAWQCRIKTGANITGATLIAGLKLTFTPTTATDADQTFFRYNDLTNSGKWQCIDYNTTVANAMDSGVTVVLSTEYFLQIFIDAARVPHYYINGVLVANGNALKDATDYLPFVGVHAVDAAAKAMTIRSMSISRLFA